MIRPFVVAGVLSLIGCGGGAGDPCAGATGACITLRVESRSVDKLDQLELDLLYGVRHQTKTVQADGGAVVSLPVHLAIEFDVPASTTLEVGVVAAGKLSGVVQGTGAGSAELEPGEHDHIDILLAEVEDCVAGSFYCGGDKIAGDPDTLYQCNGGGVPLARGRCTGGCVIRPGDDDTCRGDGGTCVDGGLYCGGDKVDGDPQTLYRCSGGVGVDGVECTDGCVVAPSGTDDGCL
jgi:hypothetical protein